MTPERERELLLRLLRLDRLTTDEQQELPGGMAQASVCRAIIREGLDRFGVFPGEGRFPVGVTAGDYVQLERAKWGAKLHISSEYSIYKYAQRTRRYLSLRWAVNSYLRHLERWKLLGAVRIDWQA